MRLTETQPKANRRSTEHAWHALWHAPVFLGLVGPIYLGLYTVNAKHIQIGFTKLNIGFNIPALPDIPDKSAN